MPSDEAKDPLPTTEIKLLVGWQKLTKQEFIEALTAALLDKIRDRCPEGSQRAQPFLVRPDAAN